MTTFTPQRFLEQPPPYRRDILTTCDTCGCIVPLNSHDLHEEWHDQNRAEAEAIQRVLDFDRRMQP